MNLDVDPDRFRRELGGWTVRVALCALPSASLAAFEFHAPFEVAAMTAGIALYIGGAAWFCSWEAMQATPGRERFVRSLKMAAWLKAALLLAAAAGLGLEAGLKMKEAACLALGLLPDVFAGLGSLWLVSLLAGNIGFEQLHGFGWILAATIVQGALISAGLGLAAAGLCEGKRVWAWWARYKSFPVRISGQGV